MKTENSVNNFEGLVSLFVEKLKCKKEVIGVVLIGGIGKRKFLDRYSDIDIGVFLSEVAKNPYMPSFSFYVNHNNRIIEFNVSQQILSKELHSVWSAEKKHAYANGIIVFQKDKVITNLLYTKLVKKSDIDFNRLVEIINQYHWRVKTHSISSFHRGYPEASHALINEGMNLLIESIFILNKKEMPHTKWLIHQLRELNYLPKDALNILRQALLIKSDDLKGISNRIIVLNTLEKEIVTEIYKQFPQFPEDPYRYWAQHISNRQIFIPTFADTICETLTKHFTNDELASIHGFICFNLVSTIGELSKVLKHMVPIPVMKSSVYGKLQTIINKMIDLNQTN